MIVSDCRSPFGKMILSDRRSQKKVSFLTLGCNEIKQRLKNLIKYFGLLIIWSTGRAEQNLFGEDQKRETRVNSDFTDYNLQVLMHRYSKNINGSV